MDYHDGTTYFTIPLHRRVMVPAKKKSEEDRLIEDPQTYIVTSEREGIWYDNEALEYHGFKAKKTIFQVSDSRWSNESVQQFLQGEHDAPTSEALFREIRDIYTTYVEYADEAYFDIMALFVMYTYVYRLFKTTGYIHFNGTAASGKSRNLSILNALAFGAVWASSMSSASLYRRIDGSPGTICVDESEGFEGERGEDLRRILNAGYVEGSKVQRTEQVKVNGQDAWTPVEYETFSPKVLASINPLEPVIASRCLIIAMRPAVRQLPDFITHDPRWGAVRDRLYLWAMENTEALAGLIEEWRETDDESKKSRLAPKLIGRQWETTHQYVILADYIGKARFSEPIIGFLNNYFTKQQEAMDATDRIRTSLRCLPRVLASKAPHEGNLYSVKDIHEVIVSYMEADSTEYFKTKHVTKNLDVLGFKHKVRAAGGLRVELDEAAVRREFQQRRVQPFEEDLDWLAGKTDYQTGNGLFDTPSPKLHTDHAWWADKEDPE